MKIADGSVVHVALPAGAKAGAPEWSADGTRYAFSVTSPDSVELWTGEAGRSAVRRIEGVRLNPFFGSEIQWMPDQRSLLVRTVPDAQGKPPARPTVPEGPDIKETAGGKASSTYEVRDVLTSDHDEANFDYYGATQLALVDVATGRVSPIGKPGLHIGASPSPDGHLLVETVHRPVFTGYDLRPVSARGPGLGPRRQAREAGCVGAARRVRADWGVPSGPREFQWRSTAPATLFWVEALDGGDWKTSAPERDRVMSWKAPFDGEAREVLRTGMRFGGVEWGEAPGVAFVTDYDPIKHWTRLQLADVDAAGSTPRKLWEMSSDELYNNPGNPVFRVLPNGFWVVEQEGDTIWLRGLGESTEGTRPFLDRFDLKSLATERLFRCDRNAYESVAAWTDRSKGQFLVRHETPTEPPNYFVRTLGQRQAGAPEGEARWTSTSTRQVTHLTDPTPQLRAITKRLVTYKRADGVDLSFTLYLPPGYRDGTRLPAVMNAYPLDYTDPKMAGQVSGSTQEFTTLAYQHELFFLLEGYAVIDYPSLPVVGDANRIYDTYMEQLISGARAAVDKAVEIGVVDRDRIGVMGHSHGGLMTVNLLTHSDLFRTGSREAAPTTGRSPRSASRTSGARSGRPPTST